MVAGAPPAEVWLVVGSESGDNKWHVGRKLGPRGVPDGPSNLATSWYQRARRSLSPVCQDVPPLISLVNHGDVLSSYSWGHLP